MTVVAPVEARPAPPALIRIHSRRRWLPEIRATIRAWPLLLTLTRRNITVKYRQTVLGVVWAFASPLVSAALFTFVFNKVAHLGSGGVPYFAFAYAGLLGWNLFTDTLTGASMSFTLNSNLVTKIYVPRLVLPLAIAGHRAHQRRRDAVHHDAAALRVRHRLFPAPAAAARVASPRDGARARHRTRDRCAWGHVPRRELCHALLGEHAAVSDACRVRRKRGPHSVRTLYLLNPMAPIVEGCRWSLLGHGDLSCRAVLSRARPSSSSRWVCWCLARLEGSFADVI